MRAAWYEQQGAARDVLIVGETEDPEPGPGKVRIRISASGINPGDVRKRQDAFGYGMPFPRIIPHSDGAGTVDSVGQGIPDEWIGQRVWCFGAQTYRPYGTAAEYTVVPVEQVVPLPDGVPFEQGACLGIPAITAHRAVHIGGPIQDRTVLAQGGAGAVGGRGHRIVAKSRLWLCYVKLMQRPADGPEFRSFMKEIRKRGITRLQGDLEPDAWEKACLSRSLKGMGVRS